MDAAWPQFLDQKTVDIERNRVGILSELIAQSDLAAIFGRLRLGKKGHGTIDIKVFVVFRIRADKSYLVKLFTGSYWVAPTTRTTDKRRKMEVPWSSLFPDVADRSRGETKRINDNVGRKYLRYYNISGIKTIA